MPFLFWVLLKSNAREYDIHIQARKYRMADYFKLFDHFIAFDSLVFFVNRFVIAFD